MNQNEQSTEISNKKPQLIEQRITISKKTKKKTETKNKKNKRTKKKKKNE